MRERVEWVLREAANGASTPSALGLALPAPMPRLVVGALAILVGIGASGDRIHHL